MIESTPVPDTTPTPASPAPCDEVYVLPASFAQQRMWFLNELEPDSAFYNIPTAARLDGRLDILALNRTLNEIIRRHEILRTTFSAQDGQPEQVIAPQGALTLEIVDLSALSPAERDAEARRLLEQEARRPFDLARGPLLRARLLRLGEDQHIILLTMHHIISDGWSMGVLIREIALLYAAYASNQPSPLVELPIQYADYVLWQMERLKDDGLAGQLAYWQNVLSGELPVLKLPSDRPRGAVQNFLGATCARKFPQALSEQLAALSRSEDATLYMTLLAAFQVLLYRYTGQDDFTIGSPIANRTRSEVEDLIGLFINTLVLRASFTPPEPEGEITFRQLLRQVRAVMLEAYANQDLPFDTLVESLHPNRDLSYNPLFQVMFILQNAPAKAYQMPGLNIEVLDVEMGTSTFDLTLSMAEQEDGLNADLEYNTDLFDPPTVERMLAHFEILLQSIAANPDTPITRLALIDAAERHQVLVAWNATHLDDPRLGLTLPALLERPLTAVADQPAVILPTTEAGSEPLTLTYRQLHARANQLAQHLRAAGVQPGDCVGICVERTLEMVVAVLGVIKSGAAYLPLDPTYPRDRLAFMLEETGAAALLTQESLLAALPETAIPSLCLDRDWATVAACSDTPPALDCSPANVAYIIYTSGSTGKPKGVQVLQRNLVNQYVAWESAYELKPGLAHLQMANFAFDVFSGDLVRALGSGGRLVLCPREFLLDPPRLYALMHREQVAIAEFVPAVLRELVKYLTASNQTLGFLQRLICGSDVWYVEEFNRVLALCGPDTHLINSFGLTEATIDSSYFDGRVLDLPPDAVTPIGKPYANNRLYILDRHLEPLPVGVPGELYVGGSAITPGYLNRPELTAERFIPDPFSANPTDRLYKTGDMARTLRDGNIQFLGRLDFQVKIRGYRVEIGEIETALKQHPRVQDAVVTALTPNRGGARVDAVLVAYLVQRGSGELALNDLRAHLRDHLPDYMVPAAFVFLEKLPLNHSGKIDRKALPAPDWSADLFGPAAYTAPRTPTEHTLAGVWAQVLGLEQVGVEDNFFDLGGHSLLATQVIARIRSALGVDVALRKVFELPTVAEMAAWMDATFAGLAQAELAAPEPAIQPAPRDKPLPLSFAQQRMWFLDQLEPGSPVYNIPDAVRLTGPLDLPAMERALNEVVRRHEILRTTFTTIDNQPVQVINPALRMTIPVTDLRGLDPAQQEAQILTLAQEEARQPFLLSRLPLLRVRLVRLAAEDNLILLTMHHIIGDDWSTNVLTGEISLLYAAYLAGQENPLPELPIQYADFAAWQHDYLSGEVLDRHIAYWKERLAGAPPLLDLPGDHPRPAIQTFHGAYQSFRLSQPTTAGLNALAKQEGVSIFMLLLAAFQVLLMRYSGQDDICVGTPIANRTRTDLENLIGFFVNTLALRTDLSGEPGFRQLLARVREVCLGAYAHQDLPFERVVEIAQPDRNLSHNPLFQVMFVLQNAPQRGESLPGVALQPVEAHSGTAKFDLTLFMLEENGVLGGAMEYSTELYEPGTIQAMLEHFEILLNSILQAPDTQIGRLTLLSPLERRRLLEEWNLTTAPFPADKLVHQWFSEQARRTPAATAVAYQEQTLTYAELDAHSNRLAHLLQQYGAGPNTIIAIYMERSLELMIALLGVLKSGAAYLPLDPTYPPERVDYMLTDSRAPLLLTQQRLLDKLPPTLARTICLDRDWASSIAPQPDGSPICTATPDDLAYIIYTSGSTGKPKGAMIRHAGLTNYLAWCLQAYPLDRGVGTPVHSSISFDLTITSLYPALLAGKTVFMLPEDLGVEALGTFLRTHEDCSLIKITPAHLKLLSEQVPPERAARVTHAFIIGGENLLVDHVRFWHEHAPATAQVNEYGPTETVVGCCVYWAPPGKHHTGIIPIGKAIINTRLYILDPYGQPVPVGVRGELYIGGVGVARGYHNRPDLTAERFLPDPFVPGERCYKTGDLVRWLPDGNIECLGRIDFQVKIRGFRVELGEVESVLGQHPAVKEAVAWVREDVSADGMAVKRLVAYVQPHDPASPPTVSGLRAFVKARLPEYMLPSAFVLMDALPLNTNGKVDRKALPDPGPLRPDLETGYSAPSSAIERVLAEIWQQVLGLEQVGVNDNFFELGGDSILSLQIIARARRRGIELTPRLLFEHPTIADLAPFSASSRLSTAEQGPVSGSAPLTPVQRWFYAHHFAAPHHWNQSVQFDLPVQIDPARLNRAVSAVLSHHDALRARFVTAENGETLMNFAPPPAPDADAQLPEVTWRDYSHLPEAEQQAALDEAIAGLQSSLDLEHGPVFRLCAFWLGKSTRLFLGAHHLVIDAVSWPILLEDLAALVQPAESGLPAQLPPKTDSYRAFAVSLQTSAAAPEILDQLPYWLEQVEGPSAALPLDDAKGRNREQDVDTLTIALAVDETQQVLSAGAGVPALLLSALAAALAEWTGADGEETPAWRIEMEGHGRTDPNNTLDLSRTVGWFTSLYPLRLSVDPRADPAENVDRVARALRRVPDFQQGYGLLRDQHPDPAIRRRLALPGRAAISFNYLGRFNLRPEGESALTARPSTGDRGPGNERTCIWEIVAGLMGDQIQLEWSYSRGLHRRATIEQVADLFRRHLRACLSGAAVDSLGGPSADQLAAFGWDQGDLQAIFDAIQPEDPTE